MFLLLAHDKITQFVMRTLLTYVYSTCFSKVSQSIATVVTTLTIGTLYGENKDTFIIKLTDPTEVKNNTLQVNLKFNSQLSDTLQGFYRVNYEDSGSDSKR